MLHVKLPFWPVMPSSSHWFTSDVLSPLPLPCAAPQSSFPFIASSEHEIWNCDWPSTAPVRNTSTSLPVSAFGVWSTMMSPLLMPVITWPTSDSRLTPSGPSQTRRSDVRSLMSEHVTGGGGGGAISTVTESVAAHVALGSPATLAATSTTLVVSVAITSVPENSSTKPPCGSACGAGTSCSPSRSSNTLVSVTSVLPTLLTR